MSETDQERAARHRATEDDIAADDAWDRHAMLKELGLKPILGSLTSFTSGNLSPGYWLDADDLLALLEKAPRVYGSVRDTDGWICALRESEMDAFGATRSGIVIGIKPLVRDTAESLLREIVADHDKLRAVDPRPEWPLVTRARALLGQREEG